MDPRAAGGLSLYVTPLTPAKALYSSGPPFRSLVLLIYLVCPMCQALFEALYKYELNFVK